MGVSRSTLESNDLLGYVISWKKQPIQRGACQLLVKQPHAYLFMLSWREENL